VIDIGTGYYVKKVRSYAFRSSRLE
jgi:prefoldin subunit 5